MNDLRQQIDDFLAHHSNEVRPIVCVSSGGTIVPLTTSASPFIDNFSLGERGANSVEYFLAHGYMVIFLYRTESRFPFTKNIYHHFSDHIDHNLLSRIIHRDEEDGASYNHLSVQQSHLTPIQKELVQLEGKILRNVVRYKFLLTLPFRAIEEYLDLLEYLGKALAFFGPRACFYLAAAVSDFYIPSDQLPTEDTFEENEADEIVLSLSQVPKRLGVLTKEWAPNAYVVSFKLETDENILLDKARRAIDKYSVHLVVANLLHTRRTACTLVSKKGVLRGESTPRGGSNAPEERFDYEAITLDAQHHLYIEKQLIDNIVSKHKEFITFKYKQYILGQTGTGGQEGNEDKDNQLLKDLLDKMFDQQNSLICKQLRYYLTNTNSKEEHDSTSPAFTPSQHLHQKDSHSHSHSHSVAVQVPRKIYRRQYVSLFGGLAMIAAMTAMKVYYEVDGGSV